MNQPDKSRLQNQTTGRKRKAERGVIRERSWTDRAGKTRSAWQADFGRVNGIRRMRSFPTKADAENWLRQQRLALADQGHAAFTLTDAERLDAIRALGEIRDGPELPKAGRLEAVAKVYRQCRDLLRDTGLELVDACRFAMKYRAAAGKKRTITEAVAEYVKDAEDNGLRPASIRSLRTRLLNMVALHGERCIAEFTRQEADAWANKKDMKPLTRRNYRTIGHGLFAFATDRGYYAAENPFAARPGRRKPKVDEKMPECMAWGDVQKIMLAAQAHEPSMVPALAVGFFAGLRTSELFGLNWKDIDLAARRITVLATVAKRRRTRHVHIEDNLLGWLAPYREASGLLAPDGQKWRSRLNNIREKASVAWPANCMRHSFASHHLQKCGDAAKTSLQLGHARDTTLLFEHYRALVTPEDAAAYFGIVPTESAVIRFPAKAG
ncbi:MAG: site-specific integrase [Verrucomicrobiota bacterium]|nr:site-specific integrase [Verrucomicrobiota bacterium]